MTCEGALRCENNCPTRVCVISDSQRGWQKFDVTNLFDGTNLKGLFRYKGR